MSKPIKILAIKFKFLGDVVLAVPAWRALKQRWPEAQLHLLVAEDAAPLVEHLPWVHKVWRFPRRRGSASAGRSWPLLRALRAEKFDRSVDFVGNDRGAIVSRLVGARERLGVIAPLGFWGRSLCYNQRIAEAPLDQHETRRDLHILTAWQVPPPASLEPELHADPALAKWAAEQLPANAIVGHLSTSQPKKEWPIDHWAALAKRISAEGHSVYLASGPSEREQRLLEEVAARCPEAKRLPATRGLAEYLALIRRARLFVSGDTGPLHFAAGLGVPTLSLFGPSRRIQFAPLGARHHSLQGGECRCSVHAAVCSDAAPCIAAITPESVWQRLREMLTLCA
jgi:ADP-heptose:LPS heptosyltransferase